MATMRDVAQRAGVSAKTVSRVINNDRYVSANVRERVERAIDELRYVPNMLAVTFRAGRDAAIGVAVPGVADPFFASIIDAVEREASKRDVAVILTSVGLAILFQVTQRQHEDQMALIRDLDVARVHGQRWRAEARLLIDGLGKAMDEQFARWNLTQAERDVALLLMKGLSLKEVATVRATNERTVRSQARMLYSKAGLSGRAALSAFFLEDLLAPAAETARASLGESGAERPRSTIQ